MSVFSVFMFWGTFAAVLIAWLVKKFFRVPRQEKPLLRIVKRSGVLRRDTSDLSRDESERWFI